MYIVVEIRAAVHAPHLYYIKKTIILYYICTMGTINNRLKLLNTKKRIGFHKFQKGRRNQYTSAILYCIYIYTYMLIIKCTYILLFRGSGDTPK